MGAASVWTGTEIIIAGGTRDDVAGLGEEAQASNSDGVRIKVTNFADGAAYDPVTDRWRPIAAAPVDALADDAIWTGRVMLVRGILAPVDPNDAPTAKMLAYEPTSDTWTSYPAPDRSSDTIGVTSVWTGTELVLWGHPYRRSETFAGFLSPRLATSPPRTSYAGVSTIAPFTRVITRYADIPEPVTLAADAWTGESILVWGGLASDDGLGKASASGWVLTP